MAIAVEKDKLKLTILSLDFPKDVIYKIRNCKNKVVSFIQELVIFLQTKSVLSLDLDINRSNKLVFTFFVQRYKNCRNIQLFK